MMHVADIDGRIYERRKREQRLQIKFAAWCVAWVVAMVLMFGAVWRHAELEAYLILAIVCGIICVLVVFTVCVLAQCVRYAIQIWKFHKNREA